MYEVRFHGRAGQGIVTASRLFAEGAILDGKYAQAFPDFGPERLGSPVSAFARINDQPIEIRSQVYTPDAVVVFEKNLLNKIPVTKGLRPDGLFIVNSDQRENLKTCYGVSFSAFLINASKIAAELGSKAVSTIMLGALAQASSLVRIEALDNALRKRFKGALGELNTRMVERGFKEVERA